MSLFSGMSADTSADASADALCIIIQANLSSADLANGNSVIMLYLYLKCLQYHIKHSKDYRDANKCNGG